MTNTRFSNWYVLLLLAAVIPIYPLVLQQGVLLQHDILMSDLLHSAFPYRAFLGDHLARGTFPLWMSDVFSGIPFLPQIEAGPLFVPNWILFGLFDPFVALNLSIVLTFLFGAAGTFLLARFYGADNISAALAGVIFALCGFNVSHIKHMSMHEAAAFLPWMILCLEKILRSKTRLALIALSLLIAGQILAGHPQITYCSLLFLLSRFLVYVVRAVWARRRGGPVLFSSGKVIGLAASVLLGIGICALQLITTFNFNRHSIRPTGVDWEFASDYPYYVPDILKFVYPAANGMVERFDYHGTIEWENYGYMGLIPLVAILASFLLIKRPVVRFYVAALLVSMLLVLGPTTPFYRIVWEILPGMSLFRFPTRFLLLVDLAGAILCALVMTHFATRLLKTRSRALVHVGLLVIFVLALSDLFYWQRIKIPIDDMDAWRTNATASVITQRDGQGRVYCPLGPEMWGQAYRGSRGFLDGFKDYRLAGQVPFGNLSVIHGLASAGGYTNMLNQKTGSFWQWYNVDLLTHLLMPTFYDQEAGRAHDDFASLLNIAAVKYLISPAPLGNDNYDLIWNGPIKVYENQTALPRAYLAYDWKNVKNIEEAAVWMFDESHNTVPAIEGWRYTPER